MISKNRTFMTESEKSRPWSSFRSIMLSTFCLNTTSDRVWCQSEKTVLHIGRSCSLLVTLQASLGMGTEATDTQSAINSLIQNNVYMTEMKDFIVGFIRSICRANSSGREQQLYYSIREREIMRSVPLRFVKRPSCLAERTEMQ